MPSELLFYFRPSDILYAIRQIGGTVPTIPGNPTPDEKKVIYGAALIEHFESLNNKTRKTVKAEKKKIKKPKLEKIKYRLSMDALVLGKEFKNMKAENILQDLKSALTKILLSERYRGIEFAVGKVTLVI